MGVRPVSCHRESLNYRFQRARLNRLHKNTIYIHTNRNRSLDQTESEHGREERNEIYQGMNSFPNCLLRRLMPSIQFPTLNERHRPLPPPIDQN